MNECHFLGNLTRDPEAGTMPDGTAVANFTIAVNPPTKRDRSDKTGTTFIDCVAYDTSAELILRDFRKGKPILVNASARTETWKTPDGQQRSRTRFRINRFHYLPSNPREESSEPVEASARPARAAAGKTPRRAAAVDDDFVDPEVDGDEQIPF
jgi:single-strand DNA-binding protein